jgi:hypothetical protein
VTSHIIDPGSDFDLRTFGSVCEWAAGELLAAHPDHTRHRIDLYRLVQSKAGGRAFYVRIKFTIPFESIIGAN